MQEKLQNHHHQLILSLLHIYYQCIVVYALSDRFCCHLHINKRRSDRFDQIDEHAAAKMIG